jgi:RNA polymerase sigma-70 factor (ECF subfamily)
MTWPTIEDARLGDLMRAAQEGDAVAYLELLHAVAPYVRRIVIHRRGFAGPADVDDLVQDILLSLHSVRATYDPRRPFVPWLLAIVRHRLADGARRYTARKTHEVSVDVDRAAAEAAGSTSDTLALRQAICALPQGQRVAIELIKLQGLSLKEAAAATGSTVGALKVATHRALAALRAILKGAGS